MKANDSQKKHSLFSASSAGRWLICPASVTFPSEGSSAAADEGTQAHALLERCLEVPITPSASVMRFPEDTQEMVDAVQEVLDYLICLYDLTRLTSEEKVALHLPFDWLPCEAQPAGTLDVFRHPTHLIDFKYGKHPVAADSDQLKFYATAKMLPAFLPQLTLAVIQPRSRDGVVVKEADFTFAEAVSFYGRVKTAVARMKAYFTTGEVPEEAFTPHPEACRFCPGRLRCNRFEESALALARIKSMKKLTQHGLTGCCESQAPLIEPLDIIEKLPLLKTFVKVLEDTLDGLKENPNASIPGYKLVELPGRRKFNVSEETLARKLFELAEITEDEATPRKMVSITDATKLLREKAKQKNLNAKQLIDEMEFLISTEKSGNTEFVKNDDPRPDVRQVMFGHVK